MPHLDWQLVVVIFALGGALWYLARRARKLIRSSRAKGTRSCGSCGSCPTAQNPPNDVPAGFVPLESLNSE